ncbi:MAG: hypothetical protein ACI4UN_08885 [Muribaculaceae bacterium]
MRRFIKNLPVGIASGIVTVIAIYLSLSSNPLGDTDIMFFENADKFFHAVMYFGVASVYYLDYAKSRLPHHTKLNGEAAVTVAAIVFSGLMEIAQGFSGRRTMDPWDFAANVAGALLAFLFMKFYFVTVFRHYLLRHRHHHHSSHHSANEANE